MEIVGYPVVGEIKKQPENVVDFNIVEEQSIDSYATKTANNTTTTGEADIIYGINMPKIRGQFSVES